MPLLFEKCAIPEALAHIQVIDFTDFPESSWGITNLIKAINPEVSQTINAVRVDGHQVTQQQLAIMPPWQKTLEMLFEQDFLSRSLSALSVRTSFNPLEVTQYCLSANHLLLSP